MSQVLQHHSQRWWYVYLLFCRINQDVENCLNKDFESTSLWLQSNVLTLNCSKSRFLPFVSKRRLKSWGVVAIRINDIRWRSYNTSFNYLVSTLMKICPGVIILKISWGRQTSHLNLSEELWELKNHHSLMPPAFDYGNINWGDKNNATLMNDLQIKQKKAATIFFNKAKYILRYRCSWELQIKTFRSKTTHAPLRFYFWMLG